MQLKSSLAQVFKEVFRIPTGNLHHVCASTGQAGHKQTIKNTANLQDQPSVISTFERDRGLCLVSTLLINCILTILQK